MTLKESRDDKVRTAGVQVRKRRNWTASESVSEADNILRHKGIEGTMAVGRLGLGTSNNCYWKTIQPKRDEVLV